MLSIFYRLTACVLSGTQFFRQVDDNGRFDLRDLQGSHNYHFNMVIPVQALPAARLPCGLNVSRLGLGLAHLQLMVPTARAALIDRALDLGITHFDTARFYGDGLSERVLGNTLGPRRTRVTITTKFGLLPTPGIAAMGPLAPFGRKARGALNRLGLVDYPRRSYSAATLQRAFAASLRALCTDYVDVLAIHEPDGVIGIDDDTIEALLAIRRSGAARFIGVAGNDVTGVLARWGDVLDIVQTAENGGRTGDRIPDFTYGLFSSGMTRGAPALPQAEIDRRLCAALARRPQGAVLVQTRDPDRLRSFAGFASV
ncbi:aldo/keto reductase [Sphingomonas aquatilis]